MISSILKSCGGGVIVGIVYAGYQFGWGPRLSFGGLLLDIIGACLLALGGILPLAAYFRNAQSFGRGDRSFYEWWICNFPIAFASKFGSADARDTSPDMRESFCDAFWGLVFLVGGFIGQALGLWVVTRG
jgi:hypothetical protein